MVNAKRKKIAESIKRLPKSQLGKQPLLSADLADRVGRLEEREKITIRLDLKVIEAAKLEAEQLGVGYQKIINDRLIEAYSLGNASYLHNNATAVVEELSKKLEELVKRIKKLEKRA